MIRLHAVLESTPVINSAMQAALLRYLKIAARDDSDFLCCNDCVMVERHRRCFQWGSKCES